MYVSMANVYRLTAPQTKCQYLCLPEKMSLEITANGT